MKGRRGEARGVLGALGLLAAVSLYRQLSMRFLPGDAARPFLVYAVYVALLLGWGVSLRSRITQRSMRTFLLLDVGIMLFWLTVRLVQEALVPQNIRLVRSLGYFIHIPAAAIPLLGLYAAFGLGRGDGYRFSRKWYLLALPAAGLIAMALTNERHHFLYRVVAGEPQPNLYFHPYYGILLLYGWGLALIAARTVVIYRRSRPVKGRSPLQRLAPFLEPLLLLAFCAPYTVSSFWVRRELVEFSAGVFFIEAASWELFIDLGLIPVNTQYETVFNRSAAGMQIVADDGSPLVRSEAAPELTADVLGQLLQGRTVSVRDGRELQAFRLAGGYLIWQQDVSQLRSVIGELRKTGAELEQESALLAQELRLKSERAAVSEQNRIYNQLTVEVGPQLALLRQLLMKEGAADQAALFRQICLIGAYVKRRCGLRLIEQSDGTVSGEDLALSFRELTGRLAEMGVEAQLSWSGAALPSSAFALVCLDVFEFLLEYERFAPSALGVSLLPDAALRLQIRPGRPRGEAAPAEELARLGGDAFSVRCSPGEGGYAVEIREGRGVPC